MSTLLRRIFTNPSTRVLVYVFVFIDSIIAFFLFTSYHTQLDLLQDQELTKLSSIANTLASQIDGDKHQALYSNYTKIDQIDSANMPADYKEIQQLLESVRVANEIGTDIYTLVFEEDTKEALFVVASGANPYFRHVWEDYPDGIYDEYKVGAKTGPFMDEHGTWLTAYAPIKNSAGEVVAVVQVDEQFDEFITVARQAVFQNIIISLGLVIVLVFLLYRSIQKILRKERTFTLELQESHAIIQQKNQDITDSINYALRIQNAMLPPSEKLKNLIPESFILFQPRDIVSGDFYWITEKDGKILIAASDCTGHGVPGAFMSMIGTTLLNDIVNYENIVQPSLILDRLDLGVVKALKQESINTDNRDGMDIALISICKKTHKMEFAGAMNPVLIHREDGEHSLIKGDRYPVGGGKDDRKLFTNHVVQLDPGSHVYIYSDGYVDQFGGPKGKKLMTKKFKSILLDVMHLSAKEKHDHLYNYLEDWKSEHEQVDDILVIGISV